jgi:hypothetical protein
MREKNGANPPDVRDDAMPLLDHFHAPLHPRHPWESFHGSWCNAIMRQLNRLLRPRYFAAFQVHLGTQVEADVAEFEAATTALTEGNGAGGLAIATWAPPAVTLTMPALFPDDIEVQVIDTRDGAVLVGVVEMVSPRNKDRQDARDAFTAKCAAYLQRGIGVVVVDVVTSRLANLHDELVDRLRQPGSCHMPEETGLYAACYRPVHRAESNAIDAWLMPLAVGQPLPTVPLALRGAGLVPVDLEQSYSGACEDSGL